MKHTISVLVENKPKQEWDEIYLISNPPYEGAKKQSLEQKQDFEYVLEKNT